MKKHLLLIGSLTAAAAASPAPAAPASSIPPAAKQDVQCFVLYSVAAGNEKDEKKIAGIIAGTWYFLGRIDAKAPGINLEQAMRTQIAALQGNPRTKEIGTACDAQFSRRGADLVTMGQALQKPAQ